MLSLDPAHRRVGLEFLSAAVGTPLRMLRCESRPTSADDFAVHVDCKLFRQDVEHAAIPLVFTVAVIPFSEGRPRGLSGDEYVEGDEFTPADLLEHLRYANGELDLHLDYMRGRKLKTTVRVTRQGILHVDTVNRGEVLPRWVGWLKGKPHLRAVPPIRIDGDEQHEDR